jgi:membrane protein YqaA with SNARE-associated domain
MSDWLASIAKWLEHYVISLPVYIAAPAMVLIGALDSSLLSLPEVNDYLVVARCYKYPSAVFYFPLFAAIGSVLGCWLLYSIMRRGGQALLRKRFRPESLGKVERAYERYGFLAIAVPAVLPPPLPFKIFVATAGALEYPRWKFIITIMVARSVRYYVEGILAVFYGERVLLFLKDNGLLIVSGVGALAVLGVLAYLLFKRLKRGAAGDEIVSRSADITSRPESPN